MLYHTLSYKIYEISVFSSRECSYICRYIHLATTIIHRIIFDKIYITAYHEVDNKYILDNMSRKLDII